MPPCAQPVGTGTGARPSLSHNKTKKFKAYHTTKTLLQPYVHARCWCIVDSLGFFQFKKVPGSMGCFLSLPVLKFVFLERSSALQKAPGKLKETTSGPRLLRYQHRDRGRGGRWRAENTYVPFVQWILRGGIKQK